MKKKLLLHSCCAPCTSGVIPQLNEYEITLLFYNPNIDTEEEYNLRLNTLKEYLVQYNEELSTNITLIEIPYNHDEYIIDASQLRCEPEGGARCKYCIAQRMEFTAKYARENGYDIFCSTLSVSPHKNHEVINTIGEELSQKYSIQYLPNNFKKNNGYLNSIRNSEKYKLYRQKYCGCEFAKSHLK
jgi:predicted adenine nucleotide alpha hydrolase (AANH) superfamily ATPase